MFPSQPLVSPGKEWARSRVFDSDCYKQNLCSIPWNCSLLLKRLCCLLHCSRTEFPFAAWQVGSSQHLWHHQKASSNFWFLEQHRQAATAPSPDPAGNLCCHPSHQLHCHRACPCGVSLNDTSGTFSGLLHTHRIHICTAFHLQHRFISK